MKEIQIRRNSLLYYLATEYGSLKKKEQNTDICSFRKEVIRGIIVTISITVLFSSIALILLSSIFWLAMAAYTGVLLDPDALVAASVIIDLMLISLGCWHLLGKGFTKLQDRFRKKERVYVDDTLKEPSKTLKVIKEMYSTLKDKYCVPVKILY